MSDLSAAPRRFRGIRRHVNTFLLTAVIGFAGVLALVAYKQGMFQQHTSIYFLARDATGINKGMSVRLYGVPVGSVKDVELAEGGGVKVRLGINNDYIPRVARSSQARLVREGVVGAASIQIVTGGAGTDRTPIAENEVIKFIPHRTMNEMVDELRQQMTPAFQELRKVAAELSNPDGDLRRSSIALRELLEELPPATRELRSVLRSTDRTMAGLGRQAESVGRQTEATLAVIERLGTQTERDFPMLAAKIATTLDSLNGTALQVRELLNQAPELVRGSGELVRDTQELTTAARQTWLLRDYIEPSQMRTLPVDSFESFGKR